MSTRRGRVILAGYPKSLPDLVCARALDRAIGCKLIIGPSDLPRDLDNPAIARLEDADSMQSASEIWDQIQSIVENGASVLRWYPDNPLATSTGKQDARDLREADTQIEIVPTVSPEIIGATFAGVPFPDTPRAMTCHPDDCSTELAVGVGKRVASPGEATLTIDHPGTPAQRTLNASSQDVNADSITFGGRGVEQRLDPNWYESLPLFGKNILVTRTLAQAPMMSRTLRTLGANPVEMPAIDIIPNPYPEQTSQAVRDLPDYDWVIFTSANGVEVFMECIRQDGYDARRFANARVAAIGIATAERLRRNFIEPDFVPDEFVAEGIIEGLRVLGIEGKRILLPRAEVARQALPDGLRESGATVDVVPVYRTIPGTPDPEVLERLNAGEIDIVTFTSSSTVTNLLAMLDGDASRLSASLIACIGPITAETVREHGLEPGVIAEEYSVPGLIDSICAALEETT